MQSSSNYGFMIDLCNVAEQSTSVFKKLIELGYSFNCDRSRELLLKHSLEGSDHTVIFLLPNSTYIGWIGDYAFDAATGYRYFYQNTYKYLLLLPLELLEVLKLKNIHRYTLDAVFGKEIHRRIRFDKNSDNYQPIYSPTPSLVL